MKIKKILLLSTTFIACALATTTLSSCVGVNSDITDNLVTRGDGSMFSQNTTFISQVKNALKSESGNSAFKKKIADDLIYSWYKENIEKLEKKDKWKELEKEIKDAYDKKIESYKSEHKGNWEYYFQNEVLDPVGGTEILYKKSEMVAKARTAFSANAFDFTKYLTLGKTKTDSVMGEVEDISTEKLLDSQNWEKINFFANAPGSRYTSTFKFPAQYARIQKLSFEEYAKKNNPTSISMSLWKYGDPKNGIESLYNKDTLKGADLKASYNFPSFGSNDATSGGSKGTEQIFGDFITGLKNNTYVDSTSGLINISKSVTEDSETQIQVNMKHLFGNGASGDSGLETIFAGSVGELLWGYMSDSESFSSISDYNIQNFNVGSDSIFDIFFNKVGADQSESLDFDRVYPGKDIKKNKIFDIFNEKSKYYGGVDSTTVITSGKNTVRLTSGTTKLPYFLTRDEFGVHFIAIDAAKYYSSRNDWSQARKNEVLKAKTLLYRENTSDYSKVEINTATKSYFDANINDLVIQLAFQDIARSDIDAPDFIFTKAKEVMGVNYSTIKTLIDSHNESKELKNKVSETRTGNQKVLEWSKAFAKNFMFTNVENITQTNVDQYKNGLATPLQFSFGIPLSEKVGENSNLLTTEMSLYYASAFQAANDDGLTHVGGNPITISSANIKSFEKKEEAAIDSLLSSSKISPNIIKTGMAQWSESILGKGIGEYVDAINMSINAFSKDGNNLVNSEKIYALKSYVGDEAKLSNYISQLKFEYLGKKIISGDKGFSSYLVDSGTWPTTQANYSIKLENMIDTDSLVGNYSEKYSDDTVNFLTAKAALVYLTKDNNKNLIEYLKSIISWDNPGAVVWLRKDVEAMNSSFNLPVDAGANLPNVSKVYGMVANYLGQSSPYSSSKILPNSYTNIFAEYDQYWHRTPISSKPDAVVEDAMGWCGLQTASSSTLPAVINEAIFTNPMKYGTKNESQYGVLARYKDAETLCERISGADAKSIRDLAAKVKNLCPISSLEIWSNWVEHETYQKGDSDIGVHDIGDKVTLTDVQKRFETINSNNDLKKELTDKKAFNSINGLSNKYLFEPKNPMDKSSSIIPETDKSFAGYRTTYMQLNYSDLLGTDYSVITKNINKVFGGQIGGRMSSVLANVIVQYALDSSIQSRAISDVIKNAYGGNKVKVFTRAMNDELGQSWVSDWKKKP